MFKSKGKFQLLFIIALVLQLITVPLYSLADETVSNSIQVDYLALGDSLAYGINSDNTPGKSYADFLAESLKSENALLSFNKGFSFPGYTVAEVLTDIQDNAVKPVMGEGYEELNVELHASIESAEIITITAGANDVLKHLNINTETQALEIDEANLKASIVQVGKDYYSILTEIRKINPTAQVYVMGYYNSFPYLADKVQPQINQLLIGLNGSINQGSADANTFFIPTADAIAADFKVNLPNPQNIHLSEAGYKVIGELFIQSVLKNYPWIPVTEPEYPEESPVPFNDIESSEFKDFILMSAEMGLVNGYKDGTFKPNAKLTRVQAASIIVRALELETDKQANFTDISNYAKETQAEIAAAVEFGIVKPNDQFNPSKSVTRAQLALMMKRTYEFILGHQYTAGEHAPFSDIDQYDAETKNAITFVYEYKIANGSNGMYMPSKAATRGQAAKMFVNFVLVD
ncbi:S-layer homology domain-containing protein [Sporosarcina siberiensis]|uniref:S-layer homology domain-containing protein n=1 Tax=Sporosarcina siberiensis TaxID=1365606 RepID=A0ABW4SG90_9BACL